MINSLDILNVQGHDETSLQFSEGVNVITGVSDAGKTSIIRSIELLRTNRPTGEILRNWNTDVSEPMAVELNTAEGMAAISREDGSNSYALSILGKGDTVFSAIKTDVPKEVSDFLQLTDINVQGQHDKYFLLQDSPGEVAKKLNELAGLDIIDTSYAFFRSQIKSVKSKIAEIKSEKGVKEIELKRYENLDKIEALIDQIGQAQLELKKARATKADLDEIRTTLKGIAEDKTVFEEALQAEKPVKNLLLKIFDLDEFAEEIKSLQVLQETLQKVSAAKEKADAIRTAEGLCLDLLTLIDKLEKTNAEMVALSSLKDSLQSITKAKCESDRSVKRLSNAYLNRMKDAGICGFCGSKITDAVLKRAKAML